LSGCPTTLNNVARLPEPLNGVFPNNNSYKNIPNVHQSTALPCPSPVSHVGSRWVQKWSNLVLQWQIHSNIFMHGFQAVSITKNACWLFQTREEQHDFICSTFLWMLKKQSGVTCLAE
jgi:hypothetical protein